MPSIQAGDERSLKISYLSALPSGSRIGGMDEAASWQVRGGAASAYEELLVPAIFAAWVPVLLERAGLESGMHVLDLACGTGVVARGAAAVLGRSDNVIGLDVNREMLAVARSIDATIEWREGEASALPFAEAEFDVVFCQQGLQFVRDKAVALGEVARVLRPEGRAVLAVWRSLSAQPVFARLVDALERHVGAEAADFLRAPFAFGRESELRELCTRAGLEVRAVEVLVRPARFASAAQLVADEVASTPLAPYFDDVEAGTVAAIVAEVADALTPWTDTSGVAFPVANHVVTAAPNR
jgi:SAM-dependent methyltransferase